MLCNLCSVCVFFNFQIEDIKNQIRYIVVLKAEFVSKLSGRELHAAPSSRQVENYMQHHKEGKKV